MSSKSIIELNQALAEYSEALEEAIEILSSIDYSKSIEFHCPKLRINDHKCDGYLAKFCTHNMSKKCWRNYLLRERENTPENTPKMVKNGGI